MGEDIDAQHLKSTVLAKLLMPNPLIHLSINCTSCMVSTVVKLLFCVSLMD